MMDKMNSMLAVEKNATRLGELRTARREKSRTESDKSDDFASELGAEMMQAGAMAQAAARPRPEAVSVSLSAEGTKASVEKGTQLDGTEKEGVALQKGAMKAVSGNLTGNEPVSLVQGQPVPGQNQKMASATEKGPTLKANEKTQANRIQNSVEMSPLSMNTAASTNTAAAIAGLKPWSKDWVFDSQTLKDIQGSIQKPAASVKPEVEAMDEAQASQTGQTGAWINLDPRTRGEAEVIQMQAGTEQRAPAAAIQHHAGLGNESLQGMIMAQPRQMDSLPQGRAVKHNSLSGNEFVATLSALRGGAEGGAAVSRMPFGEAGKQGGEGQQAEQGLPPKSRKTGGASFDSGLDSLTGMQRGLEAGLGLGTLHAPGREFAQAPQMNPVATEVTGHVVKGAMSQDRLSTESLQGISGGIRNFSMQGGGEMKVRLRPDHLGELTIRVSTQGNQVGLKIQASSEESKKILEESISHLKESMATQKLELSQVDLSVAKLGGGSFGNDSGMENSNRNQSQQFQNAWMDMGNPSGQSRGNGGQGFYESSNNLDTGGASRRMASGGAMPTPGLGRGGLNGASQLNGRLDVRA